MSLRDNQADLDYTLQRATELLGGPVRPLNLDCEISGHLLRQARRVQVTGFASSVPVRTIMSGSRGHGVSFGLERYVVTVGQTEVPMVRALNPFVDEYGSPLSDLWIVRAEHHQRLYRFLRRGVEEKIREVAPIMRTADQDRLWDNTIGFLDRGEEAFERFGVPLKRGVLLAGEPGNGKTMAARWLLTQASRLGYDWRTVRAEDYEMARAHGSAHSMFQLARPGLIFFDDLDQALRNREDVGTSGDHSTFLSELDGLSVRRGVVYLFTSNAKVKDLDPAFRRPGRIDVVIRFPSPDAEMRRRLILEHWPGEIVQAVPVEQIVEKSESLCFAEVEELKKLLVMRFLDTRQWDWPWAWQQFEQRADRLPPQRPLGFVPRSRRNGHHPHQPEWDDVPF
jgi:hypothetical protein